ncbi:MAG: hypothetical protein ACRDTX_13135 [Pseudonocardiaceae bacterium]
MTDPNIDSEPTDPPAGSPNLDDGQRREFTQQDLEDVDHSPVGPTARFHPRSRDLADRDPRIPIAFRAARWSAAALIITITTLTAWWLVRADVIGWFVGMLWRYLRWLPFVG